MKKLILLAMLGSTICSAHNYLAQARADYVDFDESMHLSLFFDVVKSQETLWGTWYSFFKKLYSFNNLSKIVPSEKSRIPKIIHQIWMGSPLPEEFKPYIETIRLLHPDWLYVLWTDDLIKELKLDNQDLFDASDNYGEKKDFLCIELLNRYGGVYLDCDIACVKSLDLFHHCYNFYVGLQPLDTGCVQLGAGVIGAAPGHPFLKRCIQKIRTSKHDQIVVRTGPIFLTQNFVGYIMETLSLYDAALPATYFYPMGYTQRTVSEEVWLKPESYAVHYWAGSWLKPLGQVKKK